jgi:hypothetical protein
MAVTKARFNVRVGVTGHRHLGSEQVRNVEKELGFALDRVRSLFSPPPNTTVILTAVSPLAEGADRLVADAVLQTTGGQLEAILPFKPDL